MELFIGVVTKKKKKDNQYKLKKAMSIAIGLNQSFERYYKILHYHVAMRKGVTN